ncbi:hypothetical protein [Hominifimenecus sp. rT4P-3]|uniref:hypothetical protein n=1 Tax=Hominifimenecus sp. rT4P-3 TaxID=3242979 RepID=UPI003DA2D4CD
MRKKVYVWLVVLVFLLSATGCGAAETSESKIEPPTETTEEKKTTAPETTVEVTTAAPTTAAPTTEAATVAETGAQTAVESQGQSKESEDGTVEAFLERYNAYVKRLQDNDMGGDIKKVSVEKLKSDGTISLGNNCELSFNPNNTTTKDSVIEVVNFQCMDKGKADVDVLTAQAICFAYTVDPDLSQDELESIISGKISSDPLRGVVYRNYSMADLILIQAKMNAD